MAEPLDTRQLRAFVTLARHGSFTLAAKALCLSQSAVSHSMRALENEIGCRLFDRMSKKVVLTQAGEQLLAREIDGTAFRLIGIGLSGLREAAGEDPTDLLDPAIARRAAAERAIDRVRTRFGRDAVVRGKLYGRTKSRPSDDDIEEGKTK